MKKQIPQRAEGWKFAGAAGRFTVWHAGKNDYRVTDGEQGEVVRFHEFLGSAHATARQLYDTTQTERITSHYSRAT